MSSTEAVDTIGDTTQEPMFSTPVIDVEEERSTPWEHHYVHGSFAGTDTRFSFYFPPREQYDGRFHQHITPVPESEHLAQSSTGQEDKVAAAFAAGAFFVESNGGGPSGGPGSDADASIAGFRANAAVARFARTVAVRLYGEHRVFGYAYGGSGGAYRTVGGAENTVGAWDGFVPYVLGSPMAVPNVFAARMHGQRVLRNVLDDIVDAIEPGGSGDPTATLSEEEAAAFHEVRRMGFPTRAWHGHRTMGTQAFGLLYPSIKLADPTYFDDFWTVPGYLGADPSSSVHRDRVVLDSSVSRVLRRSDRPDLGRYAEADGLGGGVDQAFKGPATGEDRIVALELAEAPSGWVEGAELSVVDGPAASARVSLRGFAGSLAVVDFPDLPNGLGDIAVGHTVHVDNSDFLAAQTYHRHQVPTADYAVWDQFRDADGKPVLPQRPVQLGPMFAAGAAGTVPTGRFTGRMIVVESLLDREAFPWQADWYRARATEHHGDRIDDVFRVWFVDNALHADEERQEFPTHTVSYLGVLHEALMQLAAWVEQDVAPAPTSGYSVVDGQVALAAGDRQATGVQPSISLTVDGGVRADVEPGALVEVEAVVDAPVGAGPVVHLAWDLDGDGHFEVDEDVTPARSVSVKRTVMAGAGTRFISVLASTQRDGDVSTSIARVDNVARARIVA